MNKSGKSKLTIVCFILVTITLSNCKEDPEPTVSYPSNPKSILDTVWTRPNTLSSIEPMLNSQGDVVMSEMFSNQYNGEIIKLLDKNTGNIKWRWNDYYTLAHGFREKLHVQIGDVLILTDGGNNYALNLLTGHTIWRTQIDSLKASEDIVKDDDGYIYKGYSSKTSNGNIYIFRALFNTGNWELVCTYNDNSNFFSPYEITEMTITKNEKGEKILAFSLHSDDPNNSKTPMVCYNFTNKSFDWEKDYGFVDEIFTDQISNNTGLIFSFLRDSYSNYVMAINVNNGEIAWIHNLTDYGIGMYLYKSQIILKTGVPGLLASYDQKMGFLKWQQTFRSLSEEQSSWINFNNCDSKIYKNNYVSLHGKSMSAVNLDNGNIAFYEYAALPNGSFHEGIVIDEVNNVFYTNDMVRTICFELPTSLK